MGSSTDEAARLARQAETLRPVTERLLSAAGIGPGMRVLDVGTGSGDVALLAGTFVGPSGSVLGIDQHEANVDAASKRAAAAALGHVSFQVADLNDPPSATFDAIVGRYVLFYQPDPVASLSRLASSLAPGGVMAFVELNVHLGDPTIGGLIWPPSQLGAMVLSWYHEAFKASGVTPFMGLRLRSALRSAGLEVDSHFEAAATVLAGPDAAEMLASIMRPMVPLVVALGVASEAEVGIDTLAERLDSWRRPATRSSSSATPARSRMCEEAARLKH